MRLDYLSWAGLSFRLMANFSLITLVLGLVGATIPPPKCRVVNKPPSAELHLYGLGYNAKHADGSCPTLDKVVNDFNILKGKSGSIRTFGLLDCGQGEFLVQAAERTGLKVNLGMFVNYDDNQFENEFANLKVLIGKYRSTFEKYIPSIIVGSETLYRKEVTPDKLATFIKRVKEHVQGQLNLPVRVTTADTKDMWYPHATLDAVDFMMVNAYPYWESIPVQDATNHLFKSIQAVKERTARANKEFVLGETGWPLGGQAMGAAIPSKENQNLFFNQFYCRANNEKLKYYYFAAFDEFWNVNETKSAWGVLKPDGSVKDNYVIPKC
ncbi:hypothetical protein DSO57_1033357 [Entomophthora muscae]|uniref:Uncharacterized protein n=1 Tax=Entomophthora muscae TaxID=34485 RepID=A0ACC2T0C1_9FUNG|nr:hypothetical protein DSO57_1033357 [Entomophthora muscae]